MALWLAWLNLVGLLYRSLQFRGQYAERVKQQQTTTTLKAQPTERRRHLQKATVKQYKIPISHQTALLYIL